MHGGRRVAIVGGNRIPFARAGGAYATVSSRDLLTTALDGLVDRFDLAGERLGEVVAGAVLRHPRDLTLTREAVLGGRLDPSTPAYDVSQACATSLQATAAVARRIALGEIEVGVAGGVDSASDAPITVGEGLRTALLRASRARSTRARLAAFAALRPRDLVPQTPATIEARTGLSMGEHAALTAVEWDIGRQEQDELAVASHHRLAAAYDDGVLADLVTPHLGLERDQFLRPDTSVEALARLTPVFGRGAAATMTAGNSTGLTDGAATVLLASDDWAAARGLPVLAHLTHVETAAVDFVTGHEGLLMAPAYALPRMLHRAGLGLDDVDLWEVHEAFAAQVLATLAAWADPVFCTRRLGLDGPLGAVPRDRLNVAGSSLATGHPFAATGARIVATLATLLARRGRGRGVISVCAAGGQGMTAILERS